MMEDIRFHIQEAKIHLQRLEDQLNAATDVEPIDLLVQLGHIQEHLCLAWHSQFTVGATYADATRIPNWNLEFELILPEY